MLEVVRIKVFAHLLGLAAIPDLIAAEAALEHLAGQLLDLLGRILDVALERIVAQRDGCVEQQVALHESAEGGQHLAVAVRVGNHCGKCGDSTTLQPPLFVLHIRQ